MNNKLGKE